LAATNLAYTGPPGGVPRDHEGKTTIKQCGSSANLRKNKMVGRRFCGSRKKRMRASSGESLSKELKTGAQERLSQGGVVKRDTQGKGGTDAGEKARKNLQSLVLDKNEKRETRGGMSVRGPFDAGGVGVWWSA